MYLRHTIRRKDGKVHRYWCRFAVFVSGGALFRRRWRSSASSMSAVVLKHGRWRAS
jgi:hypothetical protein